MAHRAGELGVIENSLSTPDVAGAKFGQQLIDVLALFRDIDLQQCRNLLQAWMNVFRERWFQRLEYIRSQSANRRGRNESVDEFVRRDTVHLTRAAERREDLVQL